MTDFTWELCHKRNREWNCLFTLVLPWRKPNFSLRLSSRYQTEGTCGEHQRFISLLLCFCLLTLLSLLQSNYPGWTGQYNFHCSKSSWPWHLYFCWHNQCLTGSLESTLICWCNVSSENLLALILPFMKLGSVGGSRYAILGNTVWMTTAVRIEG